jgi:hypothetical protein
VNLNKKELFGSDEDEILTGRDEIDKIEEMQRQKK